MSRRQVVDLGSRWRRGGRRGLSLWLWQLLLLFPFLLMAMLLPGCGTHTASLPASAVAPDFFALGEELARQLIANRRGAERGEPLIFTTLVNLDNLRQTSKFGRAMSEALATQLFQHGYGVTELRKASTIMVVDNNGEMVLSRDVKRLASQYEANAIVAGTYALTPKTVIINVKLLDVHSQAVLSVAGMEMERGQAINFMLNEQVGLLDAPLSGYER